MAKQFDKHWRDSAGNVRQREAQIEEQTRKALESHLKRSRESLERRRSEKEGLQLTLTRRLAAESKRARLLKSQVLQMKAEMTHVETRKAADTVTDLTMRNGVFRALDRLLSKCRTLISQDTLLEDTTVKRGRKRVKDDQVIHVLRDLTELNQAVWVHVEAFYRQVGQLGGTAAALMRESRRDSAASASRGT